QRLQPGRDPAAMLRQEFQPLFHWHTARQDEIDLAVRRVDAQQQPARPPADANRQRRAEVEGDRPAADFDQRGGGAAGAARRLDPAIVPIYPVRSQKLPGSAGIWQAAPAGELPQPRSGETNMKPTILAAAFAAALAAMLGPAAAEPIELQWWHAMT